MCTRRQAVAKIAHSMRPRMVTTTAVAIATLRTTKISASAKESPGGRAQAHASQEHYYLQCVDGQ